MSGGEEGVSDEDYEFEEEMELNGPSMAGAIGVLAGLESEVEANFYQVINVADLWVNIYFSCGQNGVDNIKGVALS